jgi:hypothetical protein
MPNGAASSDGRGRRLPPMRLGLLSRLAMAPAQAIDRAIGWQRLPAVLGAFTLGGLRIILRHDNLYDTNESSPAIQPPPGDWQNARTADGTFNNLDLPTMGSAGTRFGRNVPLDSTRVDPSDVLRPNPRTVSRELLTRRRFIPARSLNLLAAAWLQFMVHDWLQHGSNDPDKRWVVPTPDDDPWPGQRPLEIPRTPRDPTRAPGDDGPPTFINQVSAWWDGSQIYGSDLETQKRVRSGTRGHLAVGDGGLLPLDPATHQDVTGVTANYWLGLALMHTLFTLEHNSICDRLVAEYPSWSDDRLFNTARLVNVALMAKIHTLEWTPGILSHPALKIAMNANWWGLEGRWTHEMLGRLGSNEVVAGIPGSPTDQFGVPYSITEDFVAVYRMHPLIPDDYLIRSHRDGALIRECGFRDLAFEKVRDVMTSTPIEDLLYSFGTSNPGAICLHNYPRFLQEMERPGRPLVDLAATDILRNRERGVPRYNDFRRFLHKRPVAGFDELTGNPEWAEELRRTYDNDIESVDLMVGLYAETPPRGFGFSETAFRIFILMASRRLNSDRFFTQDYRPDVYTSAGMRWIETNGFAEVLARHFPLLSGALGPALAGRANPIAPGVTA